MPVLHINDECVPCSGILFDKDGTLLDLLATWGNWAELVLRGLEDQLAIMGAGFIVERSKVLGTQHDPQGKLIGYDPAGPLTMATEEESYGVLAWQLYAAGVPWNEALTRVKSITKNAMYELRRRRMAQPLAGLHSFLEQCSAASLKLGVVTSDGAKTTGEHLEWLNVAGYFDSVVTRDRVKNGKPAPEMAELACRELGLSPEETIIIGDSNADMQLGKGAGLRLVIGISASGDGEHLIDADVIISGFNELRITY
ncbi:haloacid dehalogenase [Paenibacillus odorifer]|uniref:Haloacid dehalogenase n=1 Tax=Paenibacillus odorifer TaxID=189426 RepID=A0ABX3GU60_9BACL|nr:MULTISPECIES: HAD-IA family hydrolase [Paenibacillus]MDH6426040.1 phosphoglycolate phosphatase [Paenibacillus sp. PastH-4]MDH6442062.1 phosphoglycolate phosphatase [Paenibacillus sp. PastF-4]MDH6527224.1 phosphoglycolate phosphatase [Paenibacillus sp. PastH-3]OMD35328.1 haloacid dehalogenase [Paenibacillus odorifer]OMD58414.1 haloacid dehalogenase [Paenibacillus odorifer]